MPFIAQREATGEILSPAEAKRDYGTVISDLICPKCDESMHRRREHETCNDVFRSSHFVHERDSDGSGRSRCGGDESPTHRTMKSIAADKLRYQFDRSAIDRVRIGDESVGEKLPDVLLLFNEPRSPYGRGIAIEWQYRNTSKDIEATEQEYLAHGISTLWLDREVFDLDQRNVDLDGGRWVNV